MFSGTCNHEVAFRQLRASPSSSTCLIYQFLFEVVTLKDKQPYVGGYNSKRALKNFVFVNPGIYSCTVDAFLEISTHLFLPYVSNLCIRNEFTDLLFNVSSHYQKRGQL